MNMTSIQSIMSYMDYLPGMAMRLANKDLRCRDIRSPLKSPKAPRDVSIWKVLNHWQFDGASFFFGERDISSSPCACFWTYAPHEQAHLTITVRFMLLSRRVSFSKAFWGKQHSCAVWFANEKNRSSKLRKRTSGFGMSHVRESFLCLLFVKSLY